MKKKHILGLAASTALIPLLFCLALGRHLNHVHRRMLQNLKIRH